MTVSNYRYEALVAEAERTMPPELAARFAERQTNGWFVGFAIYAVLVWGLYRAVDALLSDAELTWLIVLFPALFLFPISHLIPALYVGRQRRNAARYFMAHGHWPEHV